MQRKCFYTVLLTTQSCFWMVPIFGTKFRFTTLLLFGITSLRHSRSHCWSTAPCSWWQGVLLGNPLSWVGYCRPPDASEIFMMILLHFLTSWGSWTPSRLLLLPQTCSGTAASLRSTAGSRETSHQHNEPGLPAQFFFFILQGQFSTSVGSDS